MRVRASIDSDEASEEGPGRMPPRFARVAQAAVGAIELHALDVFDLPTRQGYDAFKEQEVEMDAEGRMLDHRHASDRPARGGGVSTRGWQRL